MTGNSEEVEEDEEAEDIGDIDDNHDIVHEVGGLFDGTDSLISFYLYLLGQISHDFYEIVRMNAQMSKCLGDVVVEVVLLTDQVVRQTDLERVLYSELRSRILTLKCRHVVILQQQRTRILEEYGVD